MRSRSKRLSVNLLLALGALLGAMALGELGLRLWKPRQVMVQRQPAIYLRDEVLCSRYQPGASGLIHRCFEIHNVVNVFPAMERILAEDGRTFEEMYWGLDGHFNEYGNRVFARVVFEAVERRLARSAIGGGESNPAETDNGGAR